MTIPTQLWQITIGNTMMGPGTNYIVQTVDGFGAPDYRVGDLMRPLEDGDYFGRDFLQSRKITLKITARGNDVGDVIGNVNDLLADWQSDTSNVTNYKALQMYLPGYGDAIEFHGRPRRAVADMSTAIRGKVVMTLEYQCADPRIYLVTPTVGVMYMPTSATGRTYNRTYAVTYGAGSGSAGALVVSNAGTYSTKPVFTINGPASNPKISNDVTGAFMKFSIILNSGDALVIDSYQRTVTLNGAVSRYGAMSSDSSWFDLPPGVSQLRYGGDVYDAGTNVVVTFQSAFL